ncbi:MAG: hypothetical protein LBU27_03355 [Candidatus Peribacteria bacterium]|nr:hypothetical protein [Candidatus Peribacteria bacterium]
MKFSQATEETFYDIELFNAVSNALKGKNFYMLQYFQKDAILERIQAQFPFIADMHFQMEAKADFTNKEELVATGINEIATGDREATARDGTG